MTKYNSISMPFSSSIHSYSCRLTPFIYGVLLLLAAQLLASPVLAGDAFTFLRETIPDNTEMQPGESFTKTWTLRNTGTTTWSPGLYGYTLNYQSGNKMGASSYLTVSRSVAPGGEATFRASMTAPSTPGTYTSYWRMSNASYGLFGVTVSVKIIVPSGSDEARLVGETIPDNTEMEPGETFTKTWTFRNMGTTTWSPGLYGYTLNYQSGDRMGASRYLELTRSVAPGSEAIFRAQMTAPSTPGVYSSLWRLSNDDAQEFGPRAEVEIKVASASLACSDTLGSAEYSSRRYNIAASCFEDAGWLPPVPRNAGNVLTTSTAYDYRSRMYEANWDRVHGGVDLVGSSAPYTEQTKAYAIGQGTIKDIRRTTDGFAAVWIEHTDRSGTSFIVCYGHVMASSSLSPGLGVPAGHELGRLVTSGNPTHLHFEINRSLSNFGRSGGNRTFGYVKTGTKDPLKYLQDHPAGGTDLTKPTIRTLNVSPTSVTLGSRVTITYTTVDAGGSGLSFAQLWRTRDLGGSPDPDGWQQVGGNQSLTSYQDGPASRSFSDTPPEGTFWYGVHVNDRAGNYATESTSGLSPKMVTVYGTTPPPSPTGVTASDGAFSDRIRVIWNSVSRATSYEVWRHSSNNSSSAQRVANNLTSTYYDDTGATPGRTYYYWLKAENAGGTSGFSSPDAGYRKQHSTPELSLSDSAESFPASGGSRSFSVTANGAWSWSDNRSWITSSESSTQTGNRTFTYSVSPNSSTSSRSGVITFTSGGITRTHTVSQSGTSTLTVDLVNEAPSTLSPGTLTIGSPCTFRSSIKNLGNGPSGSFNLKFYLSKDTYVSSSDIYLGSKTVPSVEGGKSSSYSATFVIPTIVRPGDYHFRWMIDADNDVVETDENNNNWHFVGAHTVEAPPIVGKPDLTATISVAAANLKWGETFRATTAVRNGGSSAAGTSVAKFYLSANSTITGNDLYLGSWNVGSFGAGSSRSSSKVFSLPANPRSGFLNAHSLFIGVIVDANSDVRESAENNNTAHDSIRVQSVNPDATAQQDFDGDGVSDIACFWPDRGEWYFRQSSDGSETGRLGYRGVLPVSGDWDGDGVTDYGYYNPSSGFWGRRMSSHGYSTRRFGFAETVPIVGDWDGDGQDDFGCYYAPQGMWYRMMSSEGFKASQFGFVGTVPIVGDWDGDDQDDYGCYHPPSGNWYRMMSSDGFSTTRFGFAGTLPVVADWDGDGQDDFGCYYPPAGMWYRMMSSNGFRTTQFGFTGTVPVVGDWDGDGQDDYGCYHAPSGRWFRMMSSSGFSVDKMGFTGTLPVQ